MTGSGWFCRAVAVLAITTPLAAQERTTRWTGGGGNNLWSNPANWTNGVPDDATVALFTGQDASQALVDLGGATRRAARVDAFMGIGSRARFVNGTLSTPFVNAASGVLVESNLTTDAPVLRLFSGMDLTVSGRILGTMDVDAAGTFTGFQDYPGRTTVREGLRVSDGWISVSPVRVLSGAALTLSGESIVGDVRSDGGTLRAEDATAAVIDTLRFASGRSRVVVETDVLEAGSLLRSPGATVHVNPFLIGGSGRLRASTIPPLSGDGGAADRLPVAPWMVGHSPGGEVFFTYDRTGANPGFRPLNESGEHAASLAPGANVRLTADASLASDLSVNTLNLNGASVTLDNATLTLAGGGVIMSGGTTERAAVRGTGTLALPATEGVFHVFKPRPGDLPSGTFSVDVPITGGMLTKSGDGELLLTRVNSYGGGTALNEGTLAAALPGAVGSGPVAFSPRSTLRLDYENPVVAQDIILNGGSAEPASISVRPGSVALEGSVSGDGALAIGVGARQGTGPLSVRLAGGGAATGEYVLSVGPLSRTTTLFIEGNYASPDSRIDAAATTYGTGTVRGELRNANNTLSPGDGPGDPGRMTVGELSFFRGTLIADIAGYDAGTGYDQLVVLDRTFLNTEPFADSALVLAPAPGFAPSPGSQFVLIDNRFAGPVDGEFQVSPEGMEFNIGGSRWRLSYAGGDGNDVVVTVVPEPGALAVLALAAAGLLRRQRY